MTYVLEIIIFLCNLFLSILKKEEVNENTLRYFFYKKTWAIICEYPSFKSFNKIMKVKLINKEVQLIDKLKLLVNCAKKKLFL